MLLCMNCRSIFEDLIYVFVNKCHVTMLLFSLSVEKDRRAACLLLLLYKGKERGCLSRLKWAEESVKEQSILPYFRVVCYK
jgi:hypothetical protein